MCTAQNALLVCKADQALLVCTAKRQRVWWSVKQRESQMPEIDQMSRLVEGKAHHVEQRDAAVVAVRAVEHLRVPGVRLWAQVSGFGRKFQSAEGARRARICKARS